MGDLRAIRHRFAGENVSFEFPNLFILHVPEELTIYPYAHETLTGFTGQQATQ